LYNCVILKAKHPLRGNKMKENDIIPVTIDGITFDTAIINGVQRFVKNGVIDHLYRCDKIDLDQLAISYIMGLFSLHDYLIFYTQLGYSVPGLMDLSHFQNLEIKNTLWENHDQTN
jgi:hypothetical protein